ncbi:MAG: DUF4097 family beta strand repeat-containing protein [Bacillota bacterium]
MQSWQQRYAVSGPCSVKVEQMDGAVRITGSEEPAVTVKATWPGEGRIEDRLEVAVGTNGIRLMVKPYRAGILGLFNRDTLLDLELTVPVGSRVEIQSGSGPVAVERTAGPVELECGSGRVTLVGVGRAQIESGSGSVQLREVNGPVTAETGSGRIDLEAALGPVRLQTGSGSVAVRRVGRGLEVETASGSIAAADVEGGVKLESGSGSIVASRIVADDLDVETGSGSVRMQALDVRSLSVETGSGGVELELLRVHPHGDLKVETGSGRVALTLPPDAGLNLEMETHGRVDFGGLPVRVLRQEDEEIRAVMGAGGPTFVIETGSGSVSLRPLQGADASSDPEVAAARLAELVKDDPALEQSEQLTRILQMVREGKLTVEEAEQILRALDGEEG